MDVNSTPNVDVPLAASYINRGVGGYASTVTNDLDQRKLNSDYVVISNAVAGSQTFKLAKRMGVTVGPIGGGDSGQIVYCIITPPGNAAVNTWPWIFSKFNNDIRASDFAGPTTTVVMTDTNFTPAFVDRTAISGADTVVLQCRSSADVAQRVFYSTAIGTWTEITDVDFTGVKHKGKMEFMDGFAFALESTNKIINSDLNSLANWSASNYITKQIKQDAPIGLMRLNNQIIAMGAETSEAFYNVGSATGSPLGRLPQNHQRIGLPQATSGIGVGLKHATNYYCTIGQRLYLVGRQAGGLYSKGVFSYNGSIFEKVSTPYIDSILADSPFYSVGVHAFGYNGKSAVAIQLTAANSGGGSTARWLMFFPVYNEWFEWTSTVFSPINSGEYFVGVGDSTKVYYFDNVDNWRDDGTNYEWRHQFKLPTPGNANHRMSWMGLEGDTARSATNISVEFSDNDGQTWQTARTIDMTSQKKILRRCGMFNKRFVRLSYTGANSVGLSKVLARID